MLALLVVLACLVLVSPSPSQPIDLLGFDFTTGSTNSEFDFATAEDSGPVIYDLNGDGVDEVIVTGREDIYVFNTDHQGPQNALYHWTAAAGYEFCSPASVAHLSEDGRPWVAVGASRIDFYSRRLENHPPLSAIPQESRTAQLGTINAVTPGVTATIGPRSSTRGRFLPTGRWRPTFRLTPSATSGSRHQQSAILTAMVWTSWHLLGHRVTESTFTGMTSTS